MKVIARVAVVLALAAGGITLAAGPAAAAEAPAAAPATVRALPAMPAAPWDDNCKNVPAVEIADNPTNVYPDQASGNDVSMYQKYGISGLNLFSYDLGWSNLAGCLPNGEAWSADINSMLANSIFTIAKNVVALDSVILRRAYTSDWMETFDPFVTRAVTSLHDAIFDPWSVVALGILGLTVMVKAYRGSLTNAVTKAGSAMLVFTAAFLILTQPVFYLHTIDDNLDSATQEITSDITGQKAVDGSMPLPADAMIAAVHKGVLYRPWVEMTFGNADSPTAKTYAARIFGDMTTTFDEAKLEGDGTDKLANIVKAKQDDFKKAAAEIAKNDPVAYSYFQGKHSGDRPSLAFRAAVAAIAASPNLVAGSLAMMVSKLMVLFALALSMIVLIVAVVRGGVGLDLLDRVLSGLTTALVWAAALPISMLLTDGALNNPQLDSLSSLFLIIAINGLVFYAAKTIAPGFAGVFRRKHAKKGMRWGKSAWQFAAGFFGARAGASEPPHQPQHVGDGVIDAELMDFEGGRHRAPEEDVYGEVWPDREPVTAQEAQALPQAPISPDDVETPAERDERTLPEKKTAAPEPEPGDDLPSAPSRREGDTTVYDIYSGNRAPGADDDSPADDDSTLSDEDFEAELAALEESEPREIEAGPEATGDAE